MLFYICMAEILQSLVSIGPTYCVRQSITYLLCKHCDTDYDVIYSFLFSASIFVF